MTFGIPGKAFHVPAPTTTMVYLTGGPLKEAHLLFVSLDGIRRGRSGQAAVGAVRFMYALYALQCFLVRLDLTRLGVK